MKALIVNHTFAETDGQGRVNARVAAALAWAGHSVTVVGRDLPDAPEGVEPEWWEKVPLAPARLPTVALRHQHFAVKAARLIQRRRQEFDVVLLNGGMTYPAADVNVCHFVHAHWARSKFHPWAERKSAWSGYQWAYTRQAVAWERSAYRKARVVVAVSELVRDQLVERVGVDRGKIEVIHNGLDELPADVSEAQARQALRDPLGLTDSDFVVFFAGELRTPRKNLDVLLRAMARLAEAFPDVHLVAAGGYDGGPNKRRVTDMGLGDRVHLLGHRRDVRGLYAGADCFAFLSHYDPFALVVTEAMAAGLPVVTSRSVGAAEVVERAGCGLVLDDATDDPVVASTLRQLRDELDQRLVYASAARSAAAELAWSRVGERYVAMMERLVG